MNKFNTAFACVALSSIALVNAQAPRQQTTSASTVLKKLQDAKLPISNVIQFTEKNDPNSLLGRPSQYTSKVSFSDDRYPETLGPDGTPQNTIEVFRNAADAKIRHDYIERVTSGVPFLMQYQILSGRILVRLDKSITPTDVNGYRVSLGLKPYT
jgi:hypothetical protein